MQKNKPWYPANETISDELKEIASELRKKANWWDYTSTVQKMAEHVTELEGLEGEEALQKASKLIYSRRKHK